MKAEIASAAASLEAELPHRPNFGCQVVVQSGEEKELQRLARKEEKKINRLLNKAGGAGENDEEAEEEFDPVDLRTKRQAALANAMAAPLFKEQKDMAAAREAQREKYPFVFDCYQEARTTAGFIQGVKMTLPAGFNRKESRKFEEVRTLKFVIIKLNSGAHMRSL